MEKNIFKSIAAKLAMAAAFLAVPAINVSCDKDLIGDELDKGKGNIEINMAEIGHGPDHVVYIGEELHMEGTIKAENKISDIEVIVMDHRDNVVGKKNFGDKAAYKGAANADFHEHIAVSKGANAGKGKVSVLVTDEKNVAEFIIYNIQLQPMPEGGVPEDEHHHDH